MSHKTEATYYCPTHGRFTVFMFSDDVPQYLDCPTCNQPSQMCSVAYMGNANQEQLEDIQAIISDIRKRANPGRPRQPLNAMGANGGSQSIERRNKKIPVDTNVKPLDEQLKEHEAKERAKMEAALSSLVE